MARRSVIALSDHDAADASLAGAKAANLARAAGVGFPTVDGFVITTEAVRSGGLADPHVAEAVRAAHDRLCETRTALAVRSSSVIEDTGESSMAGRFVSVLGVVSWDEFVDAVDAVVRSADSVRDALGQESPIAVLVQRQVIARFGGVMFGVDPVTGSSNRVVVEVVPSGPEALVGGTAIADHYVLTRGGRVERVTRSGECPPLDRNRRRELVRMARDAERVFGGPQDIEWLVDHDDRLWMLQSRPVTAIASTDANRRSVLLGPGPLAETFPAPLLPLEVDLWIPPLRSGISRALRTTGAVSQRAVDRSPVVTTVGGWAAVDLELIGAVGASRSFWQRMHPGAILRRVASAWRVGRLRVAVPSLARDIVATVDHDLSAIPRLDTIDIGELVDLLDRTRRELATVHSYEALAGMLLDGQPGPSGAALALRALHDARTAGWSDDDIIARSPVVLALVPPRLVPVPLPPSGALRASIDRATVDDLDEREALRMRARWLQEFLGRSAAELGRRLVGEGALPDVGSVGHLSLAELVTIADGGPPPSDLPERMTWTPGPPLPVAFRVTSTGELRPADSTAHRTPAAEGLPAAGGRGVGVVRQRIDGQPVPDGTILVTRHLEPQLAPVLGSLAGLISETGSALSHLAILAREAGVPAVVGVADAVRRFPTGTKLVIDGHTGEIEVLETTPDRDETMTVVEP